MAGMIFLRLRGICYRDKNKVILNPAREFIRDLDIIPYPAYHLLPIRKYAPSVVYRIREDSTFVMSSRGVRQRALSALMK